MESSIHKIPRTPFSNALTSFIDKYLNKKNSNVIKKFSEKDVSLIYFYQYFHKKYLEMKKSKIVLLTEENLKQKKDMDIYLDNLDTCEYHYKRDQYKSKFLTLLKMLDSKYPTVLRDVFLIHNFTELEQNSVRDFINKLQAGTISSDKSIEWVNYNGTKLARVIYISLLNGALPKELVDFMGINIEIYGEFTSLDVQKDIELNLQNSFLYAYQLGDLNLKLKVYSSNNYKVRNNMLDRMFFLNYLVRQNNIDLTLWLSSKKKTLNYNRKDRYIGPKEINSGCTTFMGVNKVSVWRKEELPKVLMHEIFHSVEVEDRHNTSEIENFIYSHFDIQRKLNKFTVSETYVETFANILNVFFIIQDTFRYKIKKSLSLKKKKRFLKKKSLKGVKTVEEEKMEMFLDSLRIETFWIMFQAAKVINYFRYATFEEFYFPQGIREENKTKKYIQKSNVFSYLILRSAVFYNLEEFLAICLKYNKSFVLKNDIPSTVMTNFYKKTFNDIGFRTSMNRFIKFIKKLIKKKKYMEILISTRMTCLEYK